MRNRPRKAREVTVRGARTGARAPGRRVRAGSRGGALPGGSSPGGSLYEVGGGIRESGREASSGNLGRVRLVLALLAAIALGAAVVIGLGQAGKGADDDPAPPFDLEAARQELAGAPAPL